MDIRLKKEPFEYNGKDYELCCNMNVLADVQEAFNGDFNSALDGKSNFKALLVFLSAMLNDYADSQGWPERVSVKQLGREYSLNDVGMLTDAIFPLVMSALSDPNPEEDEKN